MAASVKFYVGEGYPLDSTTTGSGISFFGTSFGSSIAVGQFNSSTYLTSADGSTNFATCDNNKYIESSGVSVNGGAEINLLNVPNAETTINIRFEYDSAVQTQNVSFTSYNRSDENVAQTGVTIYA